MNKLLFAILLVTFSSGTTATPIVSSIEVNAPIDQVFTLWTTNAGVQSFFAPGSDIEASIGGRYDVYFFPEKAAGKRGAEGTRILIYEPNSRLAFTWDQPNLFSQVRGQHSWVVIHFEQINDSRTKVVLHHDGFGDSEPWKGAKAYFEAAWPIVLQRLAWTVKNGPVDWNQPPPDLMYYPDMESILDRAKSI